MLIVAVASSRAKSSAPADIYYESVLYPFCSVVYCMDGVSPFSGVIKGSDGNFYGTADGGAFLAGTVYKLSPAGVLTNVYSFCGQEVGGVCPDGNGPLANVIEGSDGNFYGTTQYGGLTAEGGTIFKLTPAGTLTTLYAFCQDQVDGVCLDGSQPFAGLLEGSDGNFYGTTYYGGSRNDGTLFRVTPAGDFTSIYSFCSSFPCTDGQWPVAGLITGSDGNFYGTTSLGGANQLGTVFKLTPAGELTTLYSFCNVGACSDGADVFGGLVESGGNFFGTTFQGGNSGGGTVFMLTPSGVLTTLYNFCSEGGDSCTDGLYPQPGVIVGSDGNLYGTTRYGGANYFGTAFRLTPSGVLTVLYSFCSQPGCADGANPTSPLLESGGNFYGTTFGGNGTVFELSTSPPPTPTATPTPTPTPTTVISVPMTLNAGKSVLGDLATPVKNLTVSNKGKEPLFINNVAASDPEFAPGTSTCPPGGLAPKKSCAIPIEFTPDAVGARTGTLTLTDNAGSGRQTVALTGTGEAAVTTSPATAVAFGTVASGKTKAESIKVTNRHKTKTLTLSKGISGPNAGDFTATGRKCGASLAPASSCTYVVTFKPTAGSGVPESATFTITDTPDLGSPHHLALSGVEG